MSTEATTTASMPVVPLLRSLATDSATTERLLRTGSLCTETLGYDAPLGTSHKTPRQSDVPSEISAPRATIRHPSGGRLPGCYCGGRRVPCRCADRERHRCGGAWGDRGGGGGNTGG